MTQKSEDLHRGVVKAVEEENRYIIVGSGSGDVVELVPSALVLHAKPDQDIHVGDLVEYEDGIPISWDLDTSSLLEPDLSVPVGLAKPMQFKVFGPGDQVNVKVGPPLTSIAEISLRGEVHALKKEVQALRDSLQSQQADDGIASGSITGSEGGTLNPVQVVSEASSNQNEAAFQTSGLSGLVSSVLENAESARAFQAQATMLDFGRFLRSKRKQAGMSQEILANKAGTSIAQLSLIERGTGKRGPTLDLVARLMWALDLSLSFETEVETRASAQTEAE